MARPDLVAQISIISGKYGLLAATDPVEPYDLRLDDASASLLQSRVAEQIGQRMAHRSPASIVVLAEPPYARALSALGEVGVQVHWFTKPVEMWPAATDVLRAWGWLSD